VRVARAARTRFDEAGQLDQGLIFVAFNQDPERRFLAIQERLAGEPLSD
jgi:deferrochelatase/peroxidase EfeB